jgi:hypothetical protein
VPLAAARFDGLQQTEHLIVIIADNDRAHHEYPPFGFLS